MPFTCAQVMCTAPSTTGYGFSGAGGDLTNAAFAPTGVACDTGYVGTVRYTKCTSDGGAYSVSGCQANEPYTFNFHAKRKMWRLCPTTPRRSHIC